MLFEDPFPFFARDVPGTTQPRRPPDQMQAMFMQQQNMQKGNLKPLWEMLGIAFSGSESSDEFQPIPGEDEMLGGADQIVFQNYNPYPKRSDFPPEFVFIDNACGGKGFDPFSEKDPISSGLQHLLFPAPGHIEKRNSSKLLDREFEPLVRTGTKSGTLHASQMIMRMMGMAELNPDRPHKLGHEYRSMSWRPILRAACPRRPPADPKKDPKAKPEKGPDTNVNVVLVADIDMLTDDFFNLREQGEVPGMGMTFDFDNTTFVLNAIDSLAKEDRFLELRKRRPKHRTLTRIEEHLEEARKEESAARDNFRKEKDDNIKKENDKLNEEIEEARRAAQERRRRSSRRTSSGGVEIALRDGQHRVKARKEELEETYRQQIDEISNKLDAKIQNLQGWYMLGAVLLPPIAPLMLAGFVFMARRSREREGVSKSRLR